MTTVLAAIGGEAIMLPVSLLVFDQTQSTLASAIIMICGMLPDVLFAVLAAPIIDKGSKKNWIILLDGLMVLFYIAAGIFVLNSEFNYWLYLGGTLIVGTLSVFYRLAYESWYPDLIPIGLEQKGYAVSGTIYPTVMIVMAPVAAFLYERLHIGYIFILVAGITLLAIVIESMIKETRTYKKEKFSFQNYRSDLREGFVFIRKEKGIRNIYTYMSITGGVSHGVYTITQAFYQTQIWLTVTMLGFLQSAETIGRMLAGLLQYKWEVPVKKRYPFTKFVYTVYNLMDGILLLLPYPAMLLNRFLIGALGQTSGTIRHAAVQSYLPVDIRARVNSLFQVVFALGAILFQLIVGWLGLYLPYPLVAGLMAGIGLISMFILIWIPAKDNRPIYEATRAARLAEADAEIL